MQDVNSLKGQYEDIIKEHSPKNFLFKNMFRAFWVGGTICAIGQYFLNLYSYMGFNQTQASSATTVTLIFFAAVLTALNIYDKIGNYAGAGSIIPITGFANSMVSAAMEYKREGFVYGMGAKLFSIAGPVIVYGTIGSIIVGLIYYIL
ncbi:MAG: stage V sporulation protein AC [Epulopiscium sp. Nuni2H_MBin003]|nr:MAG: stage V sporulation protein AC [Epulopiscium sp. Nuni2H_MBin003]